MRWVGIFERRRRRQRARELERRLAELDRWDAEYGLGSFAPATAVPPRRSRLARLPVVVGVLLAMVAGLMHPDVLPAGLRERLGLSAERLLPAAEAPDTPGAHTFLATASDGSPIGYDPCQPLEVVVNPEGAPEDHAELVRSAVASAQEATGLSITLVGETSERDYDDREPGDPALVMWATEDEVAELAGDVAGIGGSTHLRSAYGGRAYFVTGMVVLDADAFALMPGSDWRQAVVDHEFGHLVGLGHVDDPYQLMYDGPPTMREYGSGDLAGLAELGSIPCR